MSPYSTREVAKFVEIHLATLEEWLSKGKVKPPRTIAVGAKNYRLWTDKDIQRVPLFLVHSRSEDSGFPSRGLVNDSAGKTMSPSLFLPPLSSLSCGPFSKEIHQFLIHFFRVRPGYGVRSAFHY
jgi:MerR-like DNA binding protein